MNNFKCAATATLAGTFLALTVTWALAAPASTEVRVATTPPVVIKTVPQAGDPEVSPNLREIRVTFSKPMKDGSWSWSTLGEDHFPQTTGKPRYENDGRTCVLPVKLEPGRAYATWLNSAHFGNFQDQDGRPAVPYLLVFETRGR
jgi:RNA polymerase sigma-70 factor (ECF subfamily)